MSEIEEKAKPQHVKIMNINCGCEGVYKYLENLKIMEVHKMSVILPSYIYCNKKSVRMEYDKFRKNLSPISTILDLIDLNDFIKKVSSNLNAMHDCNLIHGNLKPNNILANSERSKFYIVDCFENEIRDINALPMQKKKYLSTEQLFDKEITTYTDYWSFSLVLFYLINERKDLFNPENDYELKNVIKSFLLVEDKKEYLESKLQVKTKEKSTFIEIIDKMLCKKLTFQEISECIYGECKKLTFKEINECYPKPKDELWIDNALRCSIDLNLVIPKELYIKNIKNNDLFYSVLGDYIKSYKSNYFFCLLNMMWFNEKFKMEVVKEELINEINKLGELLNKPEIERIKDIIIEEEDEEKEDNEMRKIQNELDILTKERNKLLKEYSDELGYKYILDLPPVFIKVIDYNDYDENDKKIKLNTRKLVKEFLRFRHRSGFKLDLSDMDDNLFLFFVRNLRYVSYITYLNMSWNNYKLLHVVDILRENFVYLKDLKELICSDNRIGDDGVILLSEYIDKMIEADSNKRLSMNFSDSEMTIRGLKSVCEKFNQISSIHELYLDNNYLYNEGVEHLEKHCQPLTKLESINLGHNGLDNKCVDKICSILEKITTLKELKIDGNNFDEVDKEKIKSVRTGVKITC